MAGTDKRIAGPAYIASSVADLYTPPASTIFTLIGHMHFANTAAVARTFSMYVGATGGSTGGTELFKDFEIAANSTYDYWCRLRMSSTDFLTAVASAANSITVTIEGTQAVV